MHPQVSTIKVQNYKEKNIKINHSTYHILYKKTYKNFHISVSKKKDELEKQNIVLIVENVTLTGRTVWQEDETEKIGKEWIQEWSLLPRDGDSDDVIIPNDAALYHICLSFSLS